MKLKKGKFLGAIVLSLFLLSSCKSLKNSNTLFQSEYDKFADTANSVYVANAVSSSKDNTYKIKAFDLLSIRNIQSSNGPNPPAEGIVKGIIYKADIAGNIVLPSLGTVNLLGLSQLEAAKKIQNLYSTTLLKNPLIELIVVNFKITMLGDFAKQGNYIMERESINLIEMLGECGGLKPSADARKVKIIRGDLKNPEIIYVNLKDLNSLASDKLILQNNDIVYVPNKSLANITEGTSSYFSLLQPVFLILNIILLYTIKR